MDPAQGKEQLFDAAISEVDGFICSEFDQPKKYVKDETVDSLSFAQLPARPCDHVKAPFDLFDIQNDILLESAVDDVCASFIQHGPSALPESIRPASPVPAKAKLQLILQPTAGNKHNVMKHFVFSGGARAAEALKLVRGKAYTTLFRNGVSWNIKKAVQLVLTRMTGVHIQWAQLCPRADHVAKGPPKWQPTPDEVKEGVAFIHDYLPPDGGP